MPNILLLPAIGVRLSAVLLAGGHGTQASQCKTLRWLWVLLPILHAHLQPPSSCTTSLSTINLFVDVNPYFSVPVPYHLLIKKPAENSAGFS